MDANSPGLNLPKTSQEFALASAKETIRRLQDELSATNQEVLLLTLDLDQRVVERTAQLSKAVTALKREVTERKRAEGEVRKLNEDLNQRAEQLQLANQELEAFSYSVSHDLRAPLRHIDGYVKILATDAAGRLLEEDLETIARVSRAARRMSRMIDDLLLFARMARKEISREPVDLNRLVRSVIESFALDLADRSVDWQISDLPRVVCDASMIRLVLENLISNAIKFTKPRGEARIEVGFNEGPKEVSVYVRDNGVGFDPSYGDKLFGVFQRLHSEHDFEGTGIGLANVQRIVQRHGGRVWAEGQPDHGATFFFTLPKDGKAQQDTPPNG